MLYYLAYRCEQTSNASREHHYRRTPVNYSKDYPLLLLVPLLVVKWRLKQIKLILRYIINSMPEHAKIRQKTYIQSIGFTDFEEGSKSEIFRRCDIGASNENGCITSRHLFFRNMFETIYRVGHIFIRCSYVASPENFGFTTFFEVRKSYSSKRNQKQTDKPISHSFPDNAI